MHHSLTLSSTRNGVQIVCSITAILSADVSKSHTYVAQACLQRMGEFFKSEHGRAALLTDIPDALRYAIDYWASHVYDSDFISDDLRHAVTDFCDQNFVHWFRIQIQSMRGDNASHFMPTVDPDLDVAERLDRFRYECQDYIRDVRQLDMMISAQTVALRLAADDHPYRDMSMRGMGHLLETRFLRVGRMSDLDAALKFYHEALVRCPHDHPRRRTSSSINSSQQPSLCPPHSVQLKWQAP
jgi:hypothetical protein